MKLSDYVIPEPGFEKLFRIKTELTDTYSLGEADGGYKEVVAIGGGSFEGIISGRVLNFGGDWGFLHSGDINELNTRYILETEAGEYISVECTGKLIMSMEDMEAGESEDYYFRQIIRLTAGAEKLRWLNEIVAIGTSIITPEGNVCLDVYKLL